MKIKLILITLLFNVFNGFSQVSVSGQIKNPPKSNEIYSIHSLNSLEFNDVIIFDTARLDGQGRFSFNYKITQPTRANIAIGDQYTELYLVPNDSLFLSIDYSLFDETIYYTGRGADDNNFMASKLISYHKMLENRYSIFSDIDTYIAFEDSLISASTNNLKNQGINKYTPEFRKYINGLPKYQYLYPLWMQTTIYDDVSHTYFSKPGLHSSDDFLDIFNYDEHLAIDKIQYKNSLINFISHTNDVKTDWEIPDTLGELQMEEMILQKNFNHRKYLYKDTMRDYQLTQFLRYNIGDVKDDLPFIETLIKDYKSICSNKKYTDLIDKVYLQAKKLKPGKPAPDFTLINPTGEQVSLSSYIDKVVYIDFWATWCGPCREELPYSHALMNKFKRDKDMIFLYVNIADESKRWKIFLNEEKMEGMNLFANETQSREIMTAYLFNSIPHYVLIDKNGNLVCTDYPYPITDHLEQIEKDIRNALAK